MSEIDTQNEDMSGWREAEKRRIRRTRRTLIGVLVVLVILLLIVTAWLSSIFQPVGKVASTEESKGVTWVRSIYGWGKANNQQFWGPQGVTVGSDGTIWATTQAQNRVIGFNPDGSLDAMLYQGGNGDPKFPNAISYPTAVAVGPDGLVYIADTPRSTVWVFSRDNKLVRQMYVPTPSAIAVSKDRLVVGSASGFVIMNPTGKVLKLVGTQGKGKDQFEGVRGAAIASDGTIYIVDQYNNRLSAYDRDGKRKWIITTGLAGNNKSAAKSTTASSSAGSADMQLPAGLTIDGAGRLVVADPFGFDLVVLNAKNGKFIARYGAPGTADGQFIYPSSVAYDPSHDWFAVADTQNARVQIVRLPNSGGSTLAGARRAMTGPARACIIPLALIFIAMIIGLVYRFIRRRQKPKSDDSSDDSSTQGTSGTDA